MGPLETIRIDAFTLARMQAAQAPSRYTGAIRAGSPLQATSAPVMNEHAFDAARRRNYRGMFYIPLSPREQMTDLTRDEAARKSNWLYNNVPEARPVIDGTALDIVDTGIWPKPSTPNPAFNARVKILWGQQCGFHKAFSADAEDNFYSAQYRIAREINLRGQCFGNKLRPGDAASCPSLQLIPSYQCGNPRNAENEGWSGGRFNNKFGRALKWRFLKDPLGTKWQDVPGDDVIHFHNPFLIAQDHGMPLLTPVCRLLFTIDDIERVESTGVQMRSRVAYGIERQTDDHAGPTILPGADSATARTNEDGSTVIVQKVRAADGNDAEIWESPTGRKPYVLESTKSSEATDWTKTIRTKIAYSTLFPPSYIYDLTDLTQGTGVRFSQGKVQRVLNTFRAFQMVPQLIEEWYPFWLWQNILMGNLDDVPGGIPEDWWGYRVIMPANMSVDRGDGKTFDDRLTRGVIPAGLYYGMIFGEDEEEMQREIIRNAYDKRQWNSEEALARNVPEIPIDQIFLPPPGSPAPIAADPAAEAPTTDPNADPAAPAQK
jgi:hypothetical protein